jgi:hypothetical protein
VNIITTYRLLPVCLSQYFGYNRMTSVWGFQCLSNFGSNFVFSVDLGLSDGSGEMNENVHPVRLPAQANLQLEIKYKRPIEIEQGN